MINLLSTLSTGEYTGWLLALIIIALIWKLTWYGLAVYKALEKKDKPWFVVLFVAAFVLNDLGLLAIVYLVISKKKVTAKKK